MLDLDLTRFYARLQVKTERGKRYIWDPLRRIWLVMQPEEMVRQLMLIYLLEEKGYNKNRIDVETFLKVNTRSKRCDILVFSPAMNPFLLVECKAPHVQVDQRVFFQAANYNLALQVPYLVLTNGLSSYCCSMDYAKQEVAELDRIPDYPVPG